jgi:asparagine synthase (glutamine-hydrolysing)
MCGIAGIVRWHGAPVVEAELHALTDALAHRGPDGCGHYVAGGVALGHTRLAIIDPDGGRQPMLSPDGRVAISYNGELYNFRELRADLECAGHRFVTRSDTEVVLHAWIEWQERCLQRFRGMFAFAIVDHDREKVFLARDHFGIKPLVYFADGERLCFASELQALRHAGGFPRALDLLALDRYLALSYVPAPLTAFEGAKKLPPAHYLVAHFDGRIEAPVRYWQLELSEDGAPRAAGDWLEELEHVLRDSVRAHLVADVPFGAFLSGGVDSSLVVSLMAQQMEAPVETFSIGFDDAEHDERAYAVAVRDRWRTSHHERVVAADALELLPELVARYGEPFGDWSAVPLYRLAKLARERVPMVLSGDGGDEAFGGYSRYHRPPVGPLAALLPPAVLELAGRRSTWHWDAMIVLRPAARRALWKRRHHARIDEHDGDPMADAWRRVRSLPRLRRAQLLDYATYLPGAILTKVDIAAMSHGLEVRTPFVDRRVVELAASIPAALLVSRDGAAGGKHILKELLGRWFEPSFVARPKRGFAPPLGKWLAGSGDLASGVEQTLLDPNTHVAEYLEPDGIRALLSDTKRTGRRAEAVWLLLFLEQWLQTL